MTSPLRLLLKDGTKNAYIQDGVIVAPGSDFDGLKATEKNLMKALDSSGVKETNIQDYVITPNAGEQILPDGTQLPETSPMYGKMPNPRDKGIPIPNTGGFIPPTDQILPDGTRMRPENPMYGKPPGQQSSIINQGQRKQLMDVAMLSKLGLI